ncbi:MAG: endolytic transglycosylase MltG, partial [Armatimonadetes bacterium]|nr:endolytic transglycosylase MltG [Armatimonadota bacterium]
MSRPTEQRARRPMRQRALVLILLAALIVVGGAGAYLWSLSPVAAGQNTAKSIIRVEPGASLGDIAALLKTHGCLRSAAAFKLHAIVTGQASELKSGTYEVSSAMSAPQLIAMLAAGRQATATVTIPEGFTLAQIAQRVAEADLADEQQFQAAATARAVADILQVNLPEEVRSAEGYLFPETYHFTLGTGPEKLVARMILEFEKRFITHLWEPLPSEQRWGSLHEIVTLASLVEEEAQIESERALIAGVLKNRLERGMRLECDATVQYALGKHRQRLTYSDLQIDSPYNTYRYAGMPPGPISNPGLDCLRAALKPAHTEYLFYVARGDG